MIKYIFIIYGSFTVLTGLLVFFGLPDKPSQAWFFNAEEKRLALIRLAENQTGVDTRRVCRYLSITSYCPPEKQTCQVSKLFLRPLTLPQTFDGRQILEALRDPKCYCMWLGGLGYALANAGITNFNPLIIAGYGFSKTKTVLMATPQAAVAMVASALLTAISHRVPNMRCIFWAISGLTGLAGAVMVHSLDVAVHRNASLAGVYLMGFYNVPWVFMLSLCSSNTAGATKKGFMGMSLAVVYGNLLSISLESRR